MPIEACDYVKDVFNCVVSRLYLRLNYILNSYNDMFTSIHFERLGIDLKCARFYTARTFLGVWRGQSMFNIRLYSAVTSLKLPKMKSTLDLAAVQYTRFESALTHFCCKIDIKMTNVRPKCALSGKI